ncbi:MAG TPA: acetate uptake transporter [Ktedonobacteraceae bacterium]
MAQIAAERAEAAAPASANPAPLGLAAFALTTFVLSALNAGWYTLGAKDAPAVIGLALFYGGLGQLLAGMWEFRAGNTFGAAAFSSYGAFWLALGWGLQNGQIRLGTPEIGFYMLAWGIFTFLWLLGTLRTNAALIGVFLFLTLTFLALAIANFSGGSAWTAIGGYLGIITALLAWYTSAAGMLAAGRSAFQLPTFPV